MVHRAGSSGETFYRLSDDKVIEWLKRKVDSICEYLELMPDAIGMIRAQVVGYKITDEDKLTNDQLIHLAVGFLKEYVPSNWISMLKQSYGLDTAAIEAVYFEDVASRGKKRKADDMEGDFDDIKTPAVRNCSRRFRNVQNNLSDPHFWLLRKSSRSQSLRPSSTKLTSLA